MSSAISGGNVTDDGGAEVTARGVCWGTTQNPTIALSKTTDGTGTGAFTSNITGLTANTTYYVRAYATNSEGASYGNEITFMTNQTTQGTTVPTLTTTGITAITSINAVSGGTITADGGDSITAIGVCWGITTDPTTSDSKTTDRIGQRSYFSEITGIYAFLNQINGLQPSTKYYVRAYATNSAGTAYGNQLSFITGQIINPINFNPDLTYGSVSDMDGNIYKTIQIGPQLWMAENLKTTKYNDNRPIYDVTDFVEWPGLITGVYGWYNNDASAYKTIYGALYNWLAVNTGKLCPTGWHVPTDAEWTTFINYLGGASVAGGKLKETGTVHWISPNTGATNETGFTALPSGESISFTGAFDGIGNFDVWWSTTESDTTHASAYPVYNDGITIPKGNYGKGSVFSVRCIKD